MFKGSNFSSAILFEESFVKLKLDSTELCRLKTKLLASSENDQVGFEDFKQLTIEFLPRQQLIEGEFEELIKLNNNSYSLVNMLLGLKTNILYQSKGRGELEKKIKLIQQYNLHSHKNQKMDVFDLGAVIIFISAEEESLGRVLSANEMFFLAFGYEPEEAAGSFIIRFMPKHIA